MLKIFTCSYKRYNNREHYGYQRAMLDCVLKSGLSLQDLNVTNEEVNSWQTYVDMEADSNDRVRSEADTVLLDKMKKDRDWYLKKIFTDIRTAIKSPNEAEQTAGILLKPVLTTYGNIIKEGLYGCTERVTGLLCDLGKEREAGAMRDLGLQGMVEQLRAKNDAINEKLHERAQLRTDLQLPKSEEIRKVTDKCWEGVVDHIHASLLLCPNSETRDKIEAMIKLMNTKAAEYQKLFNMRKGRGKGKGGPTVSNPGTLPTGGGSSEGGNTGGGTPPASGGSEGGDTGGGTPPASGGSEGGSTGGGTTGNDDWGGFGG